MEEVNEFKYIGTVLFKHEWIEKVKGKAVRFPYKLYEKKVYVSGSEEILRNIGVKDRF